MSTNSSEGPCARIEKAYQNLKGPIEAQKQYAEELLTRSTNLDLGEFVPDIRKIVEATIALRERLEIDLNPDCNRLPVKQEEQTQFESDLRHHLRTPLNAIIGYSEMILEDCAESNELRIRSDLERLHAAATALLETIAQNIRFSELVINEESEIDTFRASSKPSVTGSILIVDDNESNRELLSRYLLKRGHKVGEAENGTQALEQMRSQSYDLVLLDIMMPGLSGFEVLEIVQKEDQLRNIPILMISSSDELENVVRCIELGAEDYLLKPFNQVLLNARLNACLEKKVLHDRERDILNQLRREQKRSDWLLLNILPSSIAERLKNGEGMIADRFDDVTVLFSDLVGFTSISATISPDELIDRLGVIFSTYDDLVAKYNLEKIKTIGDAYMVVGGLPEPSKDHDSQIAAFALEMQEVNKELNQDYSPPFDVRMGIHSGPVVAGIVGKTKFAYDLWGDTVNTASRMESSTAPGTIQVSSETHKRLCSDFLFGPEMTIDIKGKGEMKTYHLLGQSV